MVRGSSGPAGSRFGAEELHWCRPASRCIGFAQSATGWASFDRDGSCVFHNRAGRKLVVWSRDGGSGEEVDLGKLATPPDRWLLDPTGSAWVVCGASLARVAKGGKVGPVFTLPAEVGDLAWDARSFVLCYRTRQAYLERRDLMTGALLWTYGPKPPKGETAPEIRHHVAISEDGKVYLNSGNGFQLQVLDSAKGTLLAVLPFTFKGEPAPALGDGDRGALAWWMNNNCALLAVPATQLPAPALTRSDESRNTNRQVNCANSLAFRLKNARRRGVSGHSPSSPPFHTMTAKPFITAFVISFALVLPLRAAEVTARPSEHGVTVKIDGRPFSEYIIQSGSKPILWPIIGPTGKPLTRAYPMVKGGHEKDDHPHHRSLGSSSLRGVVSPGL